MSNKKELAEKIRKARAIRSKVDKLSETLESLKDEIKGLMEIGETILVDDVKASLFETTRMNFQRKDFEAWWNRPIPEKFFKQTTTATLKLS